jgi:hypothetical protein
MAKRVVFSEGSARRIGNAVRAVERGNRDQSPIFFRSAGGDDSSVAVKLGKTTSAWTKGTSHEVQLWPSGVISSPVETQNATNRFADVATGKWVMIALEDGGDWYLISAEC